MEENSELVELLEDVLGKCGLHYPNRGQISFNCPICDEGRNKHNLEVNYFNNVIRSVGLFSLSVVLLVLHF